MSDVTKILVIDDEPVNLEIMEEIFEGEVALIAAPDGDQGVQMAQESLPDIILLDVGMPGKDGYEVCQELKDDFTTESIPVIFVSARDSVEERLRGYEVGGDDYITKPFDNDELQAKVNIALKIKSSQSELKTQVTDIMGTAMEAMTNLGELGVVMRFLDDSIACKSYDELIAKLFEATQSYGLSCTLQVRLDDEVLSRADCGEIKPLEAQLLERLKTEGRFYDFGHRTVINFDRVSLLVKDMPIDEPMKYGRMKDNLPQLLNGAEARIRTIMAEIALAKRQESLERLMKMTQEAVEEIDRRFEDHKEESEKIINQLIQEMDASLLSIDVTEAQEKYLLNLLESNKQKILSLYDSGMEIDTYFEKLIDALRSELI